MALLDDLRDQAARSSGIVPCSACELVRNTEDEETREELASALAGSIGLHRLEAILVKNETGVGRRTVARHRREGHQPT